MNNQTRVARVFNGTYTISGPRGHRTFKISTVSDPANKDFYGKRIVSLLVGSNNESDYRRFAFIDDRGIVVWKRFRGQDKKSDFQIYAELLWALATGDGAERFPNYQLLVSGACLRCNKKLTEPLSIETGIGPICAGKGPHRAAA